jgi:hypothetical protein
MILLWKMIIGYGFSSQEMNDAYKDPFFNPMMQYEQAFSYYRYLCMQMDYKIKCKEYENLCKRGSNAINTEKSSNKMN